MSSITAAFTPWPHQRPAFDALMQNQARRIVTVWHRRAGKDLTAFNATWLKAIEHVGNYAYFLPTYAQGKKTVWYTRTTGGLSFLDHIPSELVEKVHDTDMRIHLANGSMIQVLGTDKVDSLVGTNYLGCVFSEYALQDPAAFQYMSPILNMNGGWAWFTYTPRGKDNHGYGLFKNALELQENGRDWFAQLLTIEDTGLLNDADLDDDRAVGIPEEVIQQEYYCAWTVTNFGAYFGLQMVDAEERGRIGSDVLWDPRYPVHTAWDLGVNDYTTIWFMQEGPRGGWRAIDYLFGHSAGLEYYAKQLQEKPYYYGTHLVPHDADQREFSTGMSVTSAAEALGLYWTVVPRTAKPTQRDAVHRTLPSVIFNSDTCDHGIASLKNYSRKWDSVLKTFSNQPIHDWASHGADAFMTFCMGQEYCRDYGSAYDSPTHSAGGDYSVTRGSNYASSGPGRVSDRLNSNNSRSNGLFPNSESGSEYPKASHSRSSSKGRPSSGPR